MTDQTFQPGDLVWVYNTPYVDESMVVEIRTLVPARGDRHPAVVQYIVSRTGYHKEAPAWGKLYRRPAQRDDLLEDIDSDRDILEREQKRLLEQERMEAWADADAQT